MIWKNFARELGYTTSRLMSVIIITALAVLIHVALAGVIYNGDRITESYHKEQNVADYWITGTKFDRNDYRELKRIPGVSEIQPRIIIDAEEWHNEDIQLTLYGIADSYSINTPLIIEGDFPKNSREMMISDEFAKSKNLQIGDTYEMKIIDSDQKIKKTICALIKNPECMYHVNATTLLPDFSKFGFAYMNVEAFEDIWGKDTYNQFCIKTTDEITDAEIKNQVNAAFGNRVINVLALEDNDSAYYLANQTNGLRTIISVFPIIFFFVALLIMYSTMSRLIETARPSIGTMKALGYYDNTILLYYLLYSILVVLLGFILGVLPANRFVTTLISRRLFYTSDLPAYQMIPKYSSWGEALILTCIFCIGTAFVITAKALLEKPAECMRPKPPKKVKILMLEKIPLVWNNLNFSAKYIIRNIFRNKAKMAICVVGVTGCMALILASFAIKDSVDNFTKMMVVNAHKYDAVLSFDRSVTQAEYERIGKIDSVYSVQYEMMTNVKIYSYNKQETIRFTITDDVIELKLFDIYGPAVTVLPKDGVIIEKDIADKLGYGIGDKALFKFSDSRLYYEMPIRGISSDADGVFIGRSYWRSLSRGFKPTSVYVSTTDIKQLESRISDYDFVSSFNTRKTVTDTITNSLESLVTVVYILILFGGILALVVLSNLGIMSFYEQIRNLATLMVLGFHDKEARKLLLTENIVFSVIGVIVGMPLGIILAKKLIASSGTIEFEVFVNPFSYILASALTLCFTLLVNMVIGRKMKNIEMLGALKSVE